MISTLTSYRLYAEDMTRSLARVSAQASVEREARYYQENIGQVRTVDDLMDDYRLYSYALKAYGLEDQIGSRALIRQVLESDLSDTSSFANRLTDQRYRQLAGAFDFAAAASEPALQSQAQTDRLVEAYSEHLVRGGAIAGDKVATFEARIGGIKDVDALLRDPVMFEMTAKIVGVDPAIVSRDYLRGLILNTGEGAQPSGGAAFLRDAFSFQPDGKVAPGSAAQTDAQRAAFANRYFVAVGQSTSPQATAFSARHFEAQAKTVTSAADLLADPTVLRVLQTAFGLDPSRDTAAVLTNVLARDTGDGAHAIDALPERTDTEKARKEKLRALNAAFAFDTQGNAPAGAAASAASLARIADAFQQATPRTGDAEIALRTNAFRVQLTRMDSINDLLGNDPVYRRQAFDFILKAFDLDPATESSSKIRRVLQSDPSDPNSYVRRLNDERYENLAAAFNFDAEGKVRAERLAQPVRSQQETASLYARSFGEDQSEYTRGKVREETVAYLEGVGAVKSLDDLLENDAVLDFALRAYGLADEKLRPADIRKLLTSDLSDEDSFARSFGDTRYTDFAAAFAFTPDGRIAASGGSAQSGASFLTTQNLYLVQTLEQEVGATNEGARLALYFLRKSPDITGAFSILSDRALFEVVRTALGLPQSMSQLDIDRQAAILETRMDFDQLKDPRGLDRFISRFSALYDINNPAMQASSPALALLGGGGAGSAAPGILGLF
ncbi:DUF1217 domain-containing protein [Aureimonas mangrovi]|uniref:DUF1217 domain-containing protein n=1 Tax=Aureimonas mangrovi TaxID=2758041 RepID=UPI00163D728A|nr:DUF1217 domain-containing protein [Aureimonas mangrovi]